MTTATSKPTIDVRVVTLRERHSLTFYTFCARADGSAMPVAALHQSV
jgi:uncharacterized protein (DUF2249 family)